MDQRAGDATRPLRNVAPTARSRGPMRTIPLAGAALLVASVAAATPLVAQTTPPAAARPAAPKSVTLPPALDRVLRDYERGWRAGDASAVASLFTEDGFALSNGRPAARGQAAIRELYAGPGSTLHLRAFAYATEDTVGYIIGAYRYNPDGGDQGKFVLALRRTGKGPWRIAADIDNLNVLPRRAGPPSP